MGPLGSPLRPLVTPLPSHQGDTTTRGVPRAGRCHGPLCGRSSPIFLRRDERVVGLLSTTLTKPPGFFMKAKRPGFARTIGRSTAALADLSLDAVAAL